MIRLDRIGLLFQLFLPVQVAHDADQVFFSLVDMRLGLRARLESIQHGAALGDGIEVRAVPRKTGSVVRDPA